MFFILYRRVVKTEYTDQAWIAVMDLYKRRCSSASREQISDEDNRFNRGLRGRQSQKREDCEGEAAFDGGKGCTEGYGRSLKFQSCAMGAHTVAQGLLAPSLGLEYSTNPRYS